MIHTIYLLLSLHLPFIIRTVILLVTRLTSRQSENFKHNLNLKLLDKHNITWSSKSWQAKVVVVIRLHVEGVMVICRSGHTIACCKNDSSATALTGSSPCKPWWQLLPSIPYITWRHWPEIQGNDYSTKYFCASGFHTNRKLAKNIQRGPSRPAARPRKSPKFSHYMAGGIHTHDLTLA